jgi:hypothetical protein
MEQLWNNYGTTMGQIISPFSITIFLLTIMLSQISIAGELEQGIRFFEQQDYPHAKALWEPLANQGDARAQYNLALLTSKNIQATKGIKSSDGKEKINKYLAMSRSNGLVDGYYTSFDSIIVKAVETTPSEVSAPGDPLVWLNQQKKRAYTLQLATGKNWESMATMKKQLLSFKALEQPENIYIHKVKKTENKKPVVRYILVYGIFESYLEAKNASGQLPESIQKSSPWIRQFGVLQSIVNIKQEKTET